MRLFFAFYAFFAAKQGMPDCSVDTVCQGRMIAAMLRRKRMLVLAALLVLASAMVGWLQLNRGDTSVALTFLGYTNRPVTVTFTQVGSVGSSIVTSSVATTGSVEMVFALMLVTNNGPVPVKLSNASQPKWGNSGFVSPAWTWPAQVLRPGESVALEVGPGNFNGSWRTEVGYLSHRLQDRVYDWVSTKTNFPARRIMERLVHGPDMAWAAGGWITNLATSDLRAWSFVFGSTPMTPLSGPDLSVSVPFPARRHQYHITAPPEPAPLHLPPLHSPAPGPQ